MGRVAARESPLARDKQRIPAITLPSRRVEMNRRVVATASKVDPEAQRNVSLSEDLGKSFVEPILVSNLDGELIALG